MTLFFGRTAALATKHGKAAALGPPLWRRVGMALVVPDLDTDRFGTFTGEVERPASPRETVRLKAIAAAEAAGLALGLASEGSFGPHPALPWIAAGQEFVALVDCSNGRAVVEVGVTVRTNFARTTVRSLDEAQPFLQRAGFPRHAVIVGPNEGVGPLAKGLTDPEGVAAALTLAREASQDGLARIETDMRAHLNPTRMGEIRKVGARLARRLATPCPACHAPGFGPEDLVPGLPCADCGTPTARAVARRWRCQACGYAEARPIPSGHPFADPGDCAICNP